MNSCSWPQLRQREAQAFATLFELYSDKIYRLALSLLKEEAAAEGVVQDAFLRQIERLDQFEGRSGLGTWLYRITYNLSVDRLRRCAVILLGTALAAGALRLPQRA